MLSRETKMQLYILKEITYQDEGLNKETILEISEDTEWLVNLSKTYEEDQKFLYQKIKKAEEIERFIVSKLSQELPYPKLIEQEVLIGLITKEQQQIRSKIGMKNADMIRKNLELRNKLRNEEIAKLSESDSDYLEYLHFDYTHSDYVVEEFQNQRPWFDNSKV